MKKDTREALALILAFLVPLAPSVQLQAASYVDPANEFAICTDSADQYYPDIYSNIVVWYDDRNGNKDIYGKDISTGQEFAICTDSADQYYPDIYSNRRSEADHE